MEGYRIAIYIRLSMEDLHLGALAGKEESASISSQRDFILSYLRGKEEFKDAHLKEFVDDGYSGMDFARPGVQEMLALCRKGGIDCIIVKDLSRFGRNYLEVGNYLEQVFPFLGIRFIGINDGFDSGKLFGGAVGMDVAFQNFIYEMYSRDLSKKIKSGVSVCMKRGEYHAGCIVYGYQKARQGKGIVVDEEAAKVVRHIFREIAQGKDAKSLARELNLEGIPGRLAYKQKKGEQLNRHYEETGWHPDKVRAVIRNQVYAGDMVYRKNSRARAGESQGGSQWDENQFVIQNHHKPIVSRELFQKANHNIRKKAPVKAAHSLHQRGMIFCGCCQKRLELHKTKEPYYQCRKRGLAGGKGCDNVLVQGRVIGQILSGILPFHWRMSGMGEASLLFREYRRGLERKAKALAQRREGIPGEKIKLYERYCLGDLGQEAFSREKEALGLREASIRQKAEEISGKLAWLERERKALLEDFQPWGEEGGRLGIPEGGMVKSLVEKLVVYGEGRIEVCFRYRDGWG